MDRKTNLQTWCSYANDGSFILKTLVCAETLKALPTVRGSEVEIEISWF